MNTTPLSPDAACAGRCAALAAEIELLHAELAELRVQNRIVSAVSAARESATAFGRACAELARAYDVPQAALAVLTQAGDALQVVAEYCAPGRPSGLGELIPVVNNPILAHITTHRAPLAIADVSSDRRVAALRELFARRGTRSILIAPVFVQDELIGTVGVDAIEPRAFSEREIVLAQTISSAISQGLYNVQLFEAVQHELAERRRAERVIQAQASLLAQLSTPLIPISDRVLILPLIGELDAGRAQQVVEMLLAGLARQRADIVIIDITGIPVVDTHVAGTLLRAAHAAKLLGTETIITGIRPEVAQTLVGLDIALEGLCTFGTLQAAVAHASRRR